LNRLQPLERLLGAFPSVRLTPEDRARVIHGQELGLEVEGDRSAEWVRLLDDRGQLVAMATPGRRPGSLHPAVVLI
jgi:hypothetical protein